MNHVLEYISVAAAWYGIVEKRPFSSLHAVFDVVLAKFGRAPATTWGMGWHGNSSLGHDELSSVPPQ